MTCKFRPPCSCCPCPHCDCFLAGGHCCGCEIQPDPEDTAPLPTCGPCPCPDCKPDLESTQRMTKVVIVQRRDEAFRLMVWAGIVDFWTKLGWDK